MKLLILSDTTDNGYMFARNLGLKLWQYTLITTHWDLAGTGSALLIRVPLTKPNDRLQKYLDDHPRIHVAESTWGGAERLIEQARQVAAPDAPPEDAPSDPQGR